MEYIIGGIVVLNALLVLIVACAIRIVIQHNERIRELETQMKRVPQMPRVFFQHVGHPDNDDDFNDRVFRSMFGDE